MQALGAILVIFSLMLVDSVPICVLFFFCLAALTSFVEVLICIGG